MSTLPRRFRDAPRDSSRGSPSPARRYGYYWRPALLRPIKRLLTRMQIVQHMTVLLAVVYTTTTRLYGGAECDISVRANGLSLCLYGMYLAQFLLFYGRAYGGGEGKARTRRAD